MFSNDFFALTSTETEIISTTCPFSCKISRKRERGKHPGYLFHSKYLERKREKIEGGNTPATTTNQHHFTATIGNAGANVLVP